MGKDGIIREVQLETANGALDRLVQFLYPLDLACDMKPMTENVTLNPRAPEFRPKRGAANVRIRQIQETEASVI